MLLSHLPKLSRPSIVALPDQHRFLPQNDPQEGAKQGGTAGFLKGLGSGLMEAVHRPAEGISILTHQLGTGLRKTPDALFGEENRGYGPPLVRTHVFVLTCNSF